uniref:Putative mediator of rna polymerase ii transcription subunit 29 n=2 Tax=Culex tarsalis TaxID=7177 RepID=A0A1Q3EVV7_CULTA
MQCALALFGLFGAICLGHTYLDEDDSSSRSSKKSKHRSQSLYSIEFSRPVDAIRGGGHDDDDLHGGPSSLSPKPMTPRRVKRRSVMQRGTTSRQSGTSRRSHHSNNRSSVRNSRRKVHQNPVTKLMNQQSAGTMTLTKTFPQFVHNKNPELTESNLKSLNNDYIMSQSAASMLNNFSQAGGTTNNLNTFNHPPRHNTHTPTLPDGSPIDPIYYNMNSSSPLLQQNASWASSNPTGGGGIGGHSNPTYQHSTTNLNHSPELNDEYYTNNRPPSVRSSYSNFHGTRPLSSYVTVPGGGNLNVAQTSTGENVFASLTSQQQQQPSPLQPQQQQHHVHQHHHQQQQQQQQVVSDPMAIPQLPTRRSVSRESLRAMQFLNSGPPAYNLNYHTPPDSETTM